MPKFSVGYSTALYNPCIASTEIVEGLLDNCRERAKQQSNRKLARQQELMQVLIHSEGFLVPNYQAVFTLKGMKIEDAREAYETRSIKSLIPHIYGFESLIRVNSQILDGYFENKDILIEMRFLRPDVIFSIASSVDLTLELDQACFKQAVQGFSALPGILLANILPRNFYHIDQLKHWIPAGSQITFEVSESEAINNLSLLQQARHSLSSANFGIAIDDFGKGYSGLDRIINLKPDIIKFDRSLIQDIHLDHPKRAFVRGLINAAKNTQSVILAEGVEIIEELEVLIHLGVDLVQGFLLHKPQTAEVIKEDITEGEPEDLNTVA